MNHGRAILVASFGTSYTDNLDRTIGAVERDISETFAGWEVRRAFTSTMVVRKIREAGSMSIDSIDDAFERLKKDGFDDIVVLPTFILHGEEYDRLIESVNCHACHFEKVCVAKPVFADPEDYARIYDAILPIIDEYRRGDTCIVLMGHGSKHESNGFYAGMNRLLESSGIDDVFITTVEGSPAFHDTIEEIGERGFTDAVVHPLLLVAGDHATNDMAGDEPDSLCSMLASAGIEPRAIVRGLGEYPVFRNLYIERVREILG